jgi:hypothetical protein
MSLGPMHTEADKFNCLRASVTIFCSTATKEVRVFFFSSLRRKKEQPQEMTIIFLDSLKERKRS